MHENKLESLNLARYRGAIQRVSRPCLLGHIHDNLGESYFGGFPLVPNGFQWPTKNGHPLSFIGQIRCSDVNLVPNDDGYLLFFYDNRHWGDQPNDLGHAIVIHVPSIAARNLAELPKCAVPTFLGLVKRTVHPKVYKRVDVVFSASVSYPSYEREMITFADDVAEECYIEFCGAIQATIQIGGYPSPIQSDSMELECAKVLEFGTPNEWVLLLQLFEVGDMIWGDAGALYWFIHRDDLVANRFDRVWMITQCG